LKISKVNKKGGTFLRVLTTELCWFLVVVPGITLSTFDIVFTVKPLLSEGSSVVLVGTF
jgi:hypothetical protein